MSAQLLTAVTGTSSFLGFASLVAYLYFVLVSYRAKRSISEIIQGETLFNADQVLRILSQFSDDASRLEALKTLTDYDTTKARDLLTKVKGSVDVQKVSDLSGRHYQRVTLIAALFFLVLAALAFAYRKSQPDATSGSSNTPEASTLSKTSKPLAPEAPAQPPINKEQPKKPPTEDLKTEPKKEQPKTEPKEEQPSVALNGTNQFNKPVPAAQMGQWLNATPDGNPSKSQPALVTVSAAIIPPPTRDLHVGYVITDWFKSDGKLHDFEERDGDVQALDGDYYRLRGICMWLYGAEAKFYDISYQMCSGQTGLPTREVRNGKTLLVAAAPTGGLAQACGVRVWILERKSPRSSKMPQCPVSPAH